MLKNKMKEYSFAEIGKQYNVSDSAIRKIAKQYGLPYRENERKSMGESDWQNEIWKNESYQYEKQGTNHEKILHDYLTTRCNKYIIKKYNVSNHMTSYIASKYFLANRHHTIEYSPSCLYLEEDDLYFRTSADAVQYLDGHYGISASHQTIERKMESGKVYGFTFAHIPEEEFYSIIQHHHVVSYAFDSKWASIVEDPSLLPDFVSLDELPWVAEFKEFYGMQ